MSSLNVKDLAKMSSKKMTQPYGLDYKGYKQSTEGSETEWDGSDPEPVIYNEKKTSPFRPFGPSPANSDDDDSSSTTSSKMLDFNKKPSKVNSLSSSSSSSSSSGGDSEVEVAKVVPPIFDKENQKPAVTMTCRA